MEGVAEAVLADILLVGGKILAVAVHIRQSVHVIFLEHIIHLPEVGPQLVVEIAVADGGADDDTVVAHHSLVADYLGGNGLHKHDGIGSHAIAVVKSLGHAEDHHIVLFLCPRHIGTLVSRDPGMGLHYLGVAAVDLNLA